MKSRKNTNNSEELRNGIINSRKSKMESSICSEKSFLRRSVTEGSEVIKPRLSRFSSHKTRSKKNHSIFKMRSNDTKGIFRLMTEAPIEDSIEIVKAWDSSQKNFEKYF